MSPAMADSAGHAHVYLGEGHEHAERRTWAVIWLCGAMMVLEIVGGALFGSIALIADGLHMSTHAGALLLAALAYRYARKHADDPRFTFGTGKLGDLAGFSSAIVLAMIAVLIGYEAVSRFIAPVPIHFAEAIPIAVLGLAVNVASAWLLSGGHHHHHGNGHHGNGHHGNGHHGHRHHGHGHDAEYDELGSADEHGDGHRIATRDGALVLTVFEENHPPVFRVRGDASDIPAARGLTIETVRPDGTRQLFTMAKRGGFLESTETIPEPHTFTAIARIAGREYPLAFEEHNHDHGAGETHDHAHGAAHRDNNMRAAIIHVVADAAVSVLVIVGLSLARAFGWLWMDPVAGIAGAFVIASWSYGLIRDTGAILLDMNPDRRMTDRVRAAVEQEGDRVTDLHVWRLGPGHLGAIVAVATASDRGPEFYRARLAGFRTLSHLTVEVGRAA